MVPDFRQNFRYTELDPWSAHGEAVRGDEDRGDDSPYDRPDVEQNGGTIICRTFSVAMVRGIQLASILFSRFA